MKKIITLICALFSLYTMGQTIESLTYPFTLPKLDYSYSALRPYIDTETMKTHVTKHHQAYVDNLNKALETYTELHTVPLEQLLKTATKHPKPLRNALLNHGGGHYNHSLFWKMMSPKRSTPSKELLNHIDKAFGSLTQFKKKFTNAALSVFGSGWAWLCLDNKDQLFITTTHDQDSPISDDAVPLLGLDVWEHAYYLKYKNKRAEYIDAWWNVVDWPYVEERLNSAREAH